jgi:hypothetical protein
MTIGAHFPGFGASREAPRRNGSGPPEARHRPWGPLFAALLAALLCAGCSSAAPSKTLYERFQDEDPVVRAEAAVEAARLGDPKALPYLVDRLGDPEADVRLMASAALLQLTGPAYPKMGWRFYDPPDQRAQAQERWRQWLRQQGIQPLTAASGPAGPSPNGIAGTGPSSASSPATAPASPTQAEGNRAP